LVHYWRNNDDPNYVWSRGVTMDFAGHASGRVAVTGQSPLGVALLQSNIAFDGFHGNFEVVARMHKDVDLDGTGDYLAFLSYDTGKNQWTSARPILADGRPIANVTGL
jgi:hypothetical protein